MTSNKHATSNVVKLGLTLIGIFGGGIAAIVAFGRTRARHGQKRTGEDLTSRDSEPSIAAAPGKVDPGSAAHAMHDAWTVTPIAAVYPLPLLPDGRKPRITSHHKSRNPSRPTHDGVDWFYPVLPGDPAWKLGDGGGTTNRKWIVPPGTPAIAVSAGRIQLAGNSPTGWRVWIDHGSVRTGYFHLTELFVKQGDHVATGQQLGIVGDNPRDHDARHLHFEVSPVDRYAPVDPVPLLQSAAYLPLERTSGPIRSVEGIAAIA